MMLKKLELSGFKSFAQKTELTFDVSVTAIVGPNGSGKSNIVEAIRFVLGEQSMKSLRGKLGSDLIFKGSKSLSKLNRASVAIIFDNKKRVFSLPSRGDEPASAGLRQGKEEKKSLSLDFDEIKLSREVYSDGTSKYFLNSSEVRMRDIVEAIASVNLGSSGYHIISQGEADRLLNAPLKERREMIEDALGLKIYHYRLRESERKLERTRENLKETESLRRELAPHLKFLKKQVEKIEQAKAMRLELRLLYEGYFANENGLLKRESAGFESERQKIGKEISRLEDELASYEKARKSPGEGDSSFASLEVALSEVSRIKEDLSRKIGRMEGMIEAEEKRGSSESDETSGTIPFLEVKSFTEELIAEVDNSLSFDDIHDIKDSLMNIKNSLENFLERDEHTSKSERSSGKELERMKTMQKELQKELATIEKKEKELRNELLSKRETIAESAEKIREEEQAFFELRSKKEHLLSQLELLSVREESVKKAKVSFKEEIREAKVLVGEDIENSSKAPDSRDVTREMQEELRKKIERIKIKLEDAGGGSGEEVLKEYNDTSERDLFLEREVEDLLRSTESLTGVIEDLKQRLQKEFTSGIHKINDQFQNFFALMFGGGKAKLSVVEVEKRKRRMEDEEGNLLELDEEDEGPEIGVDIDVSLPRKKVKELEMLSGGERSLTSIALLFALSQVNPPPFLVLDETDAALDEANSQRYGDMVENLSKFSQLILVTHNRETMSRAQVLYGVTIGADGASKLLSVQFEEAVAIAK